jgi:RNA polymerase sigma factor FliA
MSSSIAFGSHEREQSILNHMPQVDLLAARLHRRCPPSVLLEDLVSAGVTGLIQATDRYDRRRNIQLNTFAEYYIRGAMTDYLRRLDPLPRAVRSFIRNRDSAIANLEHRLHHAPSDDEVAAFLDMPVQRYRYLSHIAQADVTVSLDRLGDTTGNSREALATDDRTPDAIALDSAIKSLPTRERTVTLLDLAGYTSCEIAQQLKVTVSYVSQIKHRAIVRLRVALGVIPVAP